MSASVTPGDDTDTSNANANANANANDGTSQSPKEEEGNGTPWPTIAPLTDEEGDDRTYRLLLSKLEQPLVVQQEGSPPQRCDFRHLGPHPPSLTSEESLATRIRLGWNDATLASGAKAMLIKNGTRKNKSDNGDNPGGDDRTFVLAVMAADERLDWKKMKKMLGPKSRSKGARMATVEEVWDVTGCKPGAVPPFGSLFSLPLGDRGADDGDGDGGGGGGGRKGVHTFVDRSLQRQGGVINFNCGLRTRSIQMAFQDYFELEKPELCDFVVEEKAS